MSDEIVSPQDISDLVKHLMKTKDPATVGLRRILKKKADHGSDFPLQQHVLEEFSDKEGAIKVFSKNETQVIELERKNLALENELAKQKKSAESALQAAYKKGLLEGIAQGQKEGYEKGHAEFVQQMKGIEDRLVSLLKDIEESRKVLFLEANRTVLDLSIQMVRKIITTELSVNQEIVLSVIKKALTYIADRQEFVVRVSPDDFETVTKKKDFWTSISDRLDAITVEADKRIEKGGCIVESNTGITDARIPVQIGELIDVIDTTWENLFSSEAVAQDTEEKNSTVENIQSEEVASDIPGPDEAGEESPEDEPISRFAEDEIDTGSVNSGDPPVLGQDTEEKNSTVENIQSEEVVSDIPGPDETGEKSPEDEPISSFAEDEIDTGPLSSGDPPVLGQASDENPKI